MVRLELPPPAAGSSHLGIIDDINAVGLDSESGEVTPSEASSEPISQEEGPEVASGGGGEVSGSSQSAGSEVTSSILCSWI